MKVSTHSGLAAYIEMSSAKLQAEGIAKQKQVSAEIQAKRDEANAIENAKQQARNQIVTANKVDVYV